MPLPAVAFVALSVQGWVLGGDAGSSLVPTWDRLGGPVCPLAGVLFLLSSGDLFGRGRFGHFLICGCLKVRRGSALVSPPACSACFIIGQFIGGLDGPWGDDYLVLCGMQD